MSSLGKDLSSIRESRERTLREISERTKIPERVLKAIENDTLFTDFDENRTYLRSFVRSYAKALHIDERIIRIALDQTEQNAYQDLLQKVDPFNPGEIKDEPPFSIPDEEIEGKSKKKQKRIQRTESPDTPSESKDPFQIEDHSRRSAPSEQSVNWADIGRRFKSMESKSKIWLAILIIIITIGLIYYISFSNTKNQMDNTPISDSLAQIEDDLSVSDSINLQESESGERTTKVSQNASLPDTLELLVYAARGKLEPVNVKSDLFSKTDPMPYWIEQGEAMRFNFKDTIRIRGQYSRMKLLINGRSISNFLDKYYSRSQNFVILGRTDFEDPQWIRSESDSLIIKGYPPPQTVTDRPTFDTIP